VTQQDIDAKTLRDMLDRGERVTVVDVRRGDAHAEGAISGSVNFDAYDALHAGDERAMEGLDLPEGARVVTVCTRARLPRSSCGGEDTRRSPSREEWSLEEPLTRAWVRRACDVRYLVNEGWVMAWVLP
jgi:hypothetical protein